MALDLGQRARAAFTENLNLKLLSLAFALVLYSLGHGAQAQRTINLNVVAITPPETANRVLVSSIPAQLRVTLHGPASIIDDIRTDDKDVQIDLRNGTESRVTFEPTMIPLPPGVTVEQIYPPAVDLVWEERVDRDVPVEVSIVGTPAAGYVVKGAPSVDTPKVRVRGPKNAVMVLQHVRTDAFEVNELTEGRYTRTLALERPQGDMTYDVPSVNVTLDVGREVAERPFTRVPVAVIGPPKAKTQPSEVDVRLMCPSEIIRALRPEQIVPRVEVTSSVEHGSELASVLFSLDKCQVSLTPSTVIVKW